MNAADKDTVINILVDSFFTNPSVNFVVKQDTKKAKRLRLLMEYSYFNCGQFGKIYLNKEKNCCALIIEPRKKRTTFKSLIWDIKLAVGCVGISNVRKVLRREAEIKKHHPSEPFVHFWYLGVKTDVQGKGIGSSMAKQIMSEAASEKKAVYLETSNPRNFPLYEKLGFVKAADLNGSGYGLRMYKMEQGVATDANRSS